MTSKYGAKKCQMYGIVFDSKHEAERYIILRDMEKMGEISELHLQVPYELIPEQREKSTEIYKSGPNKGQNKPGKLIERPLSYIADFVYRDKDGNVVVEDAKGMRTKEYIIKRKLMLYKNGIRIKEV